MKVTFSLLSVLSVLACSTAPGALWESGHGDIGIGFDGTTWDPHFHFHEEEGEHKKDDDHKKGEDHDHEEGNHPIIDGVEATQEEYEIDALTVRVPGPTLPSAGVAASGASSVYVLAQDETLAVSQGSPWIGIAVEEISSGLLLNDVVNLSLVDVDGPGAFSLWTTDAFGGDTALMSSLLGGSAPVSLPLDPGHYHFNMGFSEAGIYDVSFRAEGELATGGATGTDFSVRFSVVPEPTSLFLLALGGGAAVPSRKAVRMLAYIAMLTCLCNKSH